jgi:FHIPEP family
LTEKEKQQPWRPAVVNVIRRLLSPQDHEEQRRKAAQGEPTVQVTVELDTASWSAVEREKELREKVGRHVAAAVRHDLVALGIPARPAVDLRPSVGGTDGPRLLVHGRRCRLADERVAAVLGRFTGSDRRSLSELSPEELGPAVAAVCTAAIHRHPSILLGAEQLRRYQAAAVAKARADDPGVQWEPDDQQLRLVLEPVLDAGVGIGDVGAVASAMVDGELEGIPPALTAEDLIDELRASTVQIRVEGETLRWLTGRSGEDDGAFARLRESLYAESGSRFPDLDLVEASDVEPRTVCFGMNALVTPPSRLPDDQTILAVVRSLEPELQAHRWWFISTSVVRERLQQLELALPDLVGAIHDRYPIGWLALLGRTLFREEVSTRNLKEILEYLLDLGDVGETADVVRLNEPAMATVRPPTLASLPDPREVVSFLRQCSNERLHRAFPLRHEVNAIFLGAELERLVAADTPTSHLDDQHVEELVRAVRQRLAAASGPVSIALSSVPRRSVVRELLEPEFPHVPVIATQELPLPRSGRPTGAIGQ